MEQYIKEIARNFLGNLKKYWILGIICVLIATVFVVVTTFKELANKEVNEEEVVTIDEPKLVGVRSMLKLEWSFEKEEITSAYETQVNNAKESADVLSKMVNAGSFQNIINLELQNSDLEILNSDDFISVNDLSYNVVSIAVIGYDVEKIKLVEEVVREYLKTTASDIYDIDSVICISEPCPMEVEMVDGLYNFKQVINESSKNNMNQVENENQENDIKQIENVDEDMLSSLLKLPNIVIVFSSILLYAVIVFLITITNEKAFRE